MTTNRRKTERRTINTGSQSVAPIDDRRSPITQVSDANHRTPGWRAWFSTNGGASFATNALVFQTREEAQGHADELFMRWLGATDCEVRESDDPVSHVWDGVRAIPVSSRSQLARIKSQIK